jgi:class 3 adenylate cyclase
MTTPPTGTVTFLSTDIEGSTTRWEHTPEAMHVALARHDALLRTTITAQNGVVVRTGGDSFVAAFSTATAALLAAL